MYLMYKYFRLLSTSVTSICKSLSARVNFSRAGLVILQV